LLPGFLLLRDGRRLPLEPEPELGDEKASPEHGLRLRLRVFGPSLLLLLCALLPTLQGRRLLLPGFLLLRDGKRLPLEPEPELGDHISHLVVLSAWVAL